ncbi:MAG: hypothetical protein AMJ53_04590 [Gammaproteobacteria bacterium SG8_11]|nr:MAG: hypothetical protein AMJ53_04590 [Gammaproteobacteria bacterium SG8_11]
MSTTRIKFDNGKVVSKDWLDAHPDAAQALLEKHKASYPVCLCNPEKALPLYIAQKTIFYLARMPGTGDQHASYCPFFGAPPAMSGLAVYRRSAIEEKDHDRVAVKLCDGLGVRATSAAGSGGRGRGSKQGSNPQRSRLSLRALLHYLWTSAEFNRWAPKMNGKRNYYVLYKYLMAAADNIEIQNTRLSAYLYMPEPFVFEEKQDIARRAQQRLYHLLLDAGGRRKRMLVVGIVKRFTASPFGYGVHLKHAPPPLILWMKEDTLNNFLGEAGERLEDPNALLGDTHHLVMIMTVDRTTNGNLSIVKAAAMKTTHAYIPFENPYQVTLINALMPSRLFSRQLRYDADGETIVPDFLLLDAGKQAVPMYVFGFRKQARQDAAIRAHIKHCEDTNEPCWFWDVLWDKTTYPDYPDAVDATESSRSLS